MSATLITPVDRPSVRRAALRTSLPVSAFLASRLVIGVAVILGALLLHKQAGWQAQDTQHVSTSLGALGNVLAAGAVRWDSIHYLQIAQYGYALKTNTVFFPLYPMLTGVCGWILRSDVAGGMLVSLGSFAVALMLLHRLTELEIGRAAADTAVLLLAFCPLSFFFSAVYTESLFLALSVGALYSARTERWFLAAVLAAAAALTRNVGGLLVIPIAMFHFQRHGWKVGKLWYLVLIPMAVGAFLFDLHSFGDGWLAPIREESYYAERGFGGPIVTLVKGFSSALSGAERLLSGTPIFHPTLDGIWSLQAYNLGLFCVLVLTIGAVVLVRRTLPRGYCEYLVAVLLVSTWSPVGNGAPLMSFDRYTITMVPLWMVAGAALQHRVPRSIVLVCSTALLILFSAYFTTWAWIA